MCAIRPEEMPAATGQQQLSEQQQEQQRHMIVIEAMLDAATGSAVISNIAQPLTGAYSE